MTPPDDRGPAVHEGPVRERPVHEGPVREQAAREQTAHAEPADPEPAHEQTAHGQTAHGQAHPGRSVPGHPVHDWIVGPLVGAEFDPLPHRLLHEEPVARIRLRHGEGDAWLVTRYEDVKQIASDPRMSRALTVGRPITSMTPHNIAPAGGVGRADPPDHTRLRRLIAPTFGRRRMRGLREHTRERAADLARRTAEAGPPTDLAESFIGPLSSSVVVGLLGIPPADLSQVERWRAGLMSSDTTEAKGEAVKKEIVAYFADLARRRSTEPGDDLLSELAGAREDGELSTQEMISAAVMLTLNGLDAVRNIVATMVYVLLTHPEQTARLRAEPDRLSLAIDELLRYIPQRNGVGMPRIATADIEVGGVTIREGEAVYVFYPAANRDPTVFTDPDRLDLERNEAPHLAFGHGVHYCAGAQLARMEAEVILETLLDRFPGLATAVPPEQIVWRTGTVNRGPVTLPVTW
ncbi:MULTISPECIES: cytochrome P450 [unclassified Streptomyces]|uniref:cytochrome P450 n=1 Tax=unclassified Streptomyces TaxID=2593676 RepID=UPI0016602A95|nr:MULTISPECIES: cytochrome P450 [unclassified Streptomyces]